MLATAAAVTHNAPQKVTDYKEATSETRRRTATRLTLRQQVSARTRACLLALGSGSLAQPSDQVPGQSWRLSSPTHAQSCGGQRPHRTRLIKMPERCY